MSEKLEKMLEALLEKAILLAEKTGDFVIDQGNELIQQFFMWHTAEAIMGIVLGIGIMIVGMLIPKMWKETPNTDGTYDYSDVKFLGSYYDTEFASIFAYVVTIAGWVLGGAIIISDVHKLVYIMVAPKLYLLEYFWQLGSQATQ